MSADAYLLVLLEVIRDGDEADAPLDNDLLSKRLGWTASDVATRLADARAPLDRSTSRLLPRSKRPTGPGSSTAASRPMVAGRSRVSRSL